ncbi:serine hydrolase [Lysobacter soyae]|uniref:Serine hydrolase n=1 Tax=Lysobacter soyae TaxID=2764185 RepID=A0ABX8WS64_9GAMM|nr:serine hydrolase [Lysobacter sp. CJ11]QYR53689.1 serine hydrolase [Lysobacter sp. CJ11]
MRLKPLAAGLLLVTASAFAAPPQQDAAIAAAKPHVARADPDWAAFDAYVDAVRKRFDVPGIAVAIVKDGKVVLERGYGDREMGKPGKVDEHTMFAIASNTKAFTAAALQILADEKKLSMDDRVIDHLPWFRMSDPYITHDMRIRDLLAHRSGLGLGAGDLLYWPTTSYSTKEVAQRLKDVPITGSFRARYAYDNILFGVASLVIEEASGMSFKQFLSTRFFTPLGMTETRYNADDLKAGDNVATGHAKFNFTELKPVGTLTWSNAPGAGGLYSSVHDLTRWMNTMLAGGKVNGEANGKALFSERAARDLWNVLTPMPVGKPSIPELAPAVPNMMGYAQGWNVGDYQGNKLVWHTGGWPGQVSRLTLMPNSKIGVVVLTNQEVGVAFNAVTFKALDLMLNGGSGNDWLAAYGKSFDKAQSDADTSWEKHVAARKAGKPQLPLSGYAGVWRDPWYGDVSLSEAGGALNIQFLKTAQLKGRLEHWQGETFIIRWDDRSLNADAFITFQLDPDGKPVGARMESISPLTDFSFDFQDLRLAPVNPVKGA